MPRPTSMPKPRLRKGAKTYEIRVRVPEVARGGRFKGTHTTRTLSTPERKADNQQDAYRNLPEVYDALTREFDAEAESLAAECSGAAVVDRPPSKQTSCGQQQGSRELTIPEICLAYRRRVLDRELSRRRVTTWVHKNVPGIKYNPLELADRYRWGLEKRIERVAAWRIVRDFEAYEPFLKQIEASGAVSVPNRRKVLSALCRAELEALYVVARSDRARPRLKRHPVARETKAPERREPPKSTAPLLSEFLNAFIARRGASMSDERALSYRAIVRDLIEVTSDKPVSDYVISDADAFEAVLRALPANWRKKGDLKHLSIIAAAEQAAQTGLEPQAPKNVRKKWTMLGTVFKQATSRHGGMNAFQSDLLQIDKGPAANAQWDPFTSDELAKLLASELDGPLYWLTRLALYTGARTNELCQLTTDHVNCYESVHYIYFSPELRLKTGEKQSCVRSVPVRRELIDGGFLDFVAEADGQLFPGLTQHSTGRYSDAIGKKFTYHLKKIGLKRPKLSFKSLRHTFIAEFKRCVPADVETRERLIGHAVSGVAGRYGASYEAEALDMELLKVRAGVLDKLRFDFNRAPA